MALASKTKHDQGDPEGRIKITFFTKKRILDFLSCKMLKNATKCRLIKKITIFLGRPKILGACYKNVKIAIYACFEPP